MFLLDLGSGQRDSDRSFHSLGVNFDLSNIELTLLGFFVMRTQSIDTWVALETLGLDQHLSNRRVRQMALALFDSNPQELGFAVPSRKLGLEARFCISRFANGLNRGTGRFTPSFSGVPQSAHLHFGLSPWQICSMGDGKYCCSRQL